MNLLVVGRGDAPGSLRQRPGWAGSANSQPPLLGGSSTLCACRSYESNQGPAGRIDPRRPGARAVANTVDVVVAITVLVADEEPENAGGCPRLRDPDRAFEETKPAAPSRT